MVLLLSADALRPGAQQSKIVSLLATAACTGTLLGMGISRLRSVHSRRRGAGLSLQAMTPDWDRKGFPGILQHLLGTRKVGVQVRLESNHERGSGWGEAGLPQAKTTSISR